MTFSPSASTRPENVRPSVFFPVSLLGLQSFKLNCLEVFGEERLEMVLGDVFEAFTLLPSEGASVLISLMMSLTQW